MRENKAKRLKTISYNDDIPVPYFSVPGLRGAELKKSSRVCLGSPRPSHLEPLSQTPGVLLVGLPWLTIKRATKFFVGGGLPFFPKTIPAPRP